ncbi:MAG: hypothetical protein ACRDVM_03580, partial [Acidimicrobiia bacterium]
MAARSQWKGLWFNHLTSRALDPFPHHHNVVINTRCRRLTPALDARCLYQHAHTASALATAEVRLELIPPRRSLAAGSQVGVGDRRHQWGRRQRVLQAQQRDRRRPPRVGDRNRPWRPRAHRAHPTGQEPHPCRRPDHAWRQRAAKHALTTDRIEALYQGPSTSPASRSAAASASPGRVSTACSVTRHNQRSREADVTYRHREGPASCPQIWSLYVHSPRYASMPFGSVCHNQHGMRIVISEFISLDGVVQA